MGVVTDRAVIRAVKAGETDLRRVVDASPRALPTVGPDDRTLTAAEATEAKLAGVAVAAARFGATVRE